nr:unnamed protein product [Callosobruchus analis]
MRSGEFAEIIRRNVEIECRSLKEEIQSLRSEVNALKETNIYLVRQLTPNRYPNYQRNATDCNSRVKYVSGNQPKTQHHLPIQTVNVEQKKEERKGIHRPEEIGTQIATNRVLRGERSNETWKNIENEKSSDNEKNWEFPKRRIRRRQRICGRANSENSFKGGVRLVDYYVSTCPLGLSAEGLKNHLSDKGITNAKCEGNEIEVSSSI